MWKGSLYDDSNTGFPIETWDTFLHFKLAFGKVPQRWWGMWKHRGEYYNEDKTLFTNDRVPVRWITLEEKMDHVRDCMDNEEEYAWFYGVMIETFRLWHVVYLPAMWHELQNGEREGGNS
jgi:hypothetical protein